VWEKKTAGRDIHSRRSEMAIASTAEYRIASVTIVQLLDPNNMPAMPNSRDKTPSTRLAILRTEFFYELSSKHIKKRSFYRTVEKQLASNGRPTFK
jgi:hypothetical protein